MLSFPHYASLSKSTIKDRKENQKKLKKKEKENKTKSIIYNSDTYYYFYVSSALFYKIVIDSRVFSVIGHLNTNNFYFILFF